jgi:hypothetical protein
MEYEERHPLQGHHKRYARIPDPLPLAYRLDGSRPEATEEGKDEIDKRASD